MRPIGGADAALAVRTHMTVRMKDIAEDLDVSLMTVSKALRNHGDISSQTRQRVAERAQQLRYQPNWAARSLATRRTYTIGLVIPDLMHSFFAEVAKGAGNRLGPRGYHIIIANSEENAETEVREIEALLARGVDGLIVASAQKNGDWLSRTLRRRRVPHVVIDRVVGGVEACYVGVDDTEVGALATTHLIEQGCRRIDFVYRPLSARTIAARIAGNRDLTVAIYPLSRSKFWPSYRKDIRTSLAGFGIASG